MRSALVLPCGVLLIALVSCSATDTGSQPVASSPQNAAPAAAPPAGAPASPAAAPAGAPAAGAGPSAGPVSTAAAGSQPGQPSSPSPIATADGPFDGVRVEVTELKRTSGGTLTLKFRIVNDSGRRLGHSDVGVGFGGLILAPYAIDGVHVIDTIGKKKYFVAKDAAGGCVCSQFGFVEGGSRANHWAKFAAPPEDVARLSVVIPSFAPLDDVPVSR